MSTPLTRAISGSEPSARSGAAGARNSATSASAPRRRASERTGAIMQNPLSQGEMSRLLVSLDDYGLPPVPARRVAGFANKGRARNASADFGRTLAESAVFGNGRIPAGF